MWNSMALVDDYETQPLADAMGLVLGTSHTEPMVSQNSKDTVIPLSWVLAKGNQRMELLWQGCLAMGY